MQEEKEREIRYKDCIILLPGREIRLKVVENIEALITDVEDEERVPCWADIWPAAHALARFIWDNLRFNSGERVLELGAGMGLPGIVCGLKGAHTVLSDFNPTALEMAAFNARENGIEVELLKEDWRTFSCREQFDWILASDILYDPKLNPYLGKIFHNNLKPGGHILVSHPRRQVTFAFLESWLDSNHFQQDMYSVEVELEGSLLSRYIISIHLFASLKTSDGDRTGKSPFY